MARKSSPNLPCHSSIAISEFTPTGHSTLFSREKRVSSVSAGSHSKSLPGNVRGVMVLALVIHTVSSVTAKVPFAMVSLLDHVRKKDLPPELRCRQVFPTSGLRSTSLWDTTDTETLQLWLDEFLDADCTNEVLEVQEEFAFGISAELTRLRTAEKVTANTRATAAAVHERTKSAAAVASQQVTELDAKYRVSEQAASAVKAAREAGRVASTRLSSSLGKMHARAMENQQVSAAASSISAGWKRIGANVPFLNRSPTGSETESPMRQADPAFEEPAASSSAPAPSVTTATEREKSHDEARPTIPKPPRASSASPAAASASASNPPTGPIGGSAAKPPAQKRDVFTLDDADHEA